jgi:hypothetical protein
VENKLSTSCGQNLSFHYKWKSDHSTFCGNRPFHLVWKSDHSTLCGKQAAHLAWTNLSFPPCMGILFCFTKSNNNNNPILKQLSKKFDCKTSVTNTITSQRHLISNIINNLMYDIETNPGPGEKLKIITINCRGLGEIKKFRLLFNRAYDIMQKR